MCLIALASGVSQKYKLIIAANRDEFLNRPAMPAHKWEGTDLYAGKDIQAGGTWLGITERGDIAAITNYRDLINRKDYNTSRGSLVTEFLLGNHTPEAYLEILKKDAELYDGYNLIWGNPDELFYYSNKEGDGIRIEQGIQILSNHLLNTPWFKSVRFRSAFSKAIESDEGLTGRLLQLLQDEQKAPDHMLPSTGLPVNIEKEISSIFIRMENYGTRCSTIITIDQENNVSFTERSHQPAIYMKEYNFKIIR